MLDRKHNITLPQHEHDNNIYTRGAIGKHNIVIAAPVGVGTVHTAVLVADMRRTFPDIKHFLLVGIAGGAPSETRDIRLGDVVVGSAGVLRYNLDSPKVGQKPPSTLQRATDHCAKSLVRANCLDKLVNDSLEKYPRMRQKFKRPSPETDILYPAWVNLGSHEPGHVIQRQARHANARHPAVHYGIIASVDVLVKDALMRDELAARHDVLCFDMESAGASSVEALVIRGISNYSDTHKTDAWLGYAAMTAAAYAKTLIIQVD